MRRIGAHAAQGKSAPEYDALEFVLTHGDLEPDVKERVMSQDFPITNLKRLVDSAYVSGQLELDRGDPELTTTASKKWVLGVLREIVTIISREQFEDEKPFSVKDIYDSNDQKKFFNRIVGKHPKPSRKTKRWTISSNTSVSSGDRVSRKRIKPHRPTLERKKLIPKNCGVLPPSGRANDIMHELRKLDVDMFRNAVSVLFRVFLEFSAEEYMIRRAVLAVTSSDTLAKKLRAVIMHMEDNAIMTKKDLTAANRAANDPHSMISTVQLNAYVHNQDFYPSSSELKTSWDNLEPFVEKLWHA